MSHAKMLNRRQWIGVGVAGAFLSTESTSKAESHTKTSSVRFNNTLPFDVVVGLFSDREGIQHRQAVPHDSDVKADEKIYYGQRVGAVWREDTREIIAWNRIVIESSNVGITIDATSDGGYQIYIGDA